MNNINILFIPEFNKHFDSVNLLQEMFLRSLQDHYQVSIWNGSYSSSQEIQKALADNDIIFGLDQRILIERKHIGSRTPMLLPSYGIGTRAFFSLYELRHLMQRGDSFICPSSPDLSAATSHIIQDDISFFLIPYPLKHDFLEERSSINATEIFKAYGVAVNEQERILIYAGRMNQQKNVHILLRMFKSLLGLYKSPIRLVCIGSEDTSGFPEMRWFTEGYESEIHEQVYQLGLQEHVSFIPRVQIQAMPDIYRASDIHVSCSTFRTEDFGFTPIEAMFCGIPTVGTNWGGFLDTIEHGVTGYRMPVYITDSGFRIDWLSGAEVINHLLTNQETYQYMSRNCRAIAASKYHPLIFSNRLKLTIDSIVSKSPREAQPIDDIVRSLSQDVQMFFKDIDKALQSTSSLSTARQDLFIAQPDRIAAFFSSYAPASLPSITSNTLLYCPLPLITTINNLEVRAKDRNWPNSVSISKQEQKILDQIHITPNTPENLAYTLKLPLSEVINITSNLCKKGLVLSKERIFQN